MPCRLRTKLRQTDEEPELQQAGIDCRDLVGMAIAKRAAGRNWRQIRDDLLFYLRGRGIAPQIRGTDEDYELLFSDGTSFYHRASGEYGCEGPEQPKD
jgi:hypothetical protein